MGASVESHDSAERLAGGNVRLEGSRARLTRGLVETAVGIPLLSLMFVWLGALAFLAWRLVTLL